MSWSKLEQAIRKGIRPDVAVGCVPRRHDLPTGTVAAVECSPDARLVDRVGFYLFPDGDQALDAYLARMEQAGVTLNKDNGARGFEDNLTACYDEDAHDPDCLHDRHAVFLNAAGNANYRAVVGRMYMGVLGTRADVRDLWHWSFTTDHWPDPPDGEMGAVPEGPTLYEGKLVWSD